MIAEAKARAQEAKPQITNSKDGEVESKGAEPKASPMMESLIGRGKA